jgi:hypothetical protein
MKTLENVMNLPLCGVFLILLVVLCFVAFSIVTVKYTLQTLFQEAIKPA